MDKSKCEERAFSRFEKVLRYYWDGVPIPPFVIDNNKNALRNTFHFRQLGYTPDYYGDVVEVPLEQEPTERPGFNCICNLNGATSSMSSRIGSHYSPYVGTFMFHEIGNGKQFTQEAPKLKRVRISTQRCESGEDYDDEMRWNYRKYLRMTKVLELFEPLVKEHIPIPRDSLRRIVISATKGLRLSSKEWVVQETCCINDEYTRWMCESIFYYMCMDRLYRRILAPLQVKISPQRGNFKILSLSSEERKASRAIYDAAKRNVEKSLMWGYKTRSYFQAIKTLWDKKFSFLVLFDLTTTEWMTDACAFLNQLLSSMNAAFARIRIEFYTNCEDFFYVYIANAKQVLTMNEGQLRASEFQRIFTATRIFLVNQLRAMLFENLGRLVTFFNCNGYAGRRITRRIAEKHPILIVEMIVGDNFQPSSPAFTRLVFGLSDLLEETVVNVNGLPQAESVILRTLDLGSEPLNVVSQTELAYYRSSLMKILNEVAMTIDSISARYSMYSALPAQDMKIARKGTAEEIKAHVIFLRETISAVRNASPDIVYCGCIEVKCKAVKKHFVEHWEEFLKKFYEELHKATAVIIEVTESKCVDAQRALCQAPSTVAELEQYLEDIKAAGKLCDRLRMKECKVVIGRVACMEEIQVPIENELYLSALKFMKWPGILEEEVAKAEVVKVSCRPLLLEQLARVRKITRDNIKTLSTGVTELYNMFSLDICDIAAQTCNELRELVNQIIATIDSIFKQEHSLHIVTVDSFDDFYPLFNYFETIEQYWATIYRIARLRECNTAPVSTLNAEKVIDNVRECRRFLHSSTRNLRAFPPLVQLGKQQELVLAKFEEREHLVWLLTTPGLRKNHWKEMARLLASKLHGDVSFVTDPNVSLQKLLDAGIADFTPELQRIASQARNDYSVETLLEEMKSSAKKTYFRVTTIPGVAVSHTVVDPECLQSILANVEGFILSCRLMRRKSGLSSVVLKALSEWEYATEKIRNVLVEWPKVEARWREMQCFLLTIKATSKTTPDKETVFIIDKLTTASDAAESLNAALRKPQFSLYTAIVQETINDLLFHVHNAMDDVSNMLGDVLERMRATFPRFNFLTDAQLKTFMSVYNIKSLVKLLPIMYARLANVDVEGGSVVAFTSVDGTTISASTPIPLTAEPTEVWMQTFDRVLAQSVFASIRNCIGYYKEVDMDDWVLSYSSQEVVMVLRIFHTRDMRTALSLGGTRALASYKRKIVSMHEELNRIVRMPAVSTERRTTVAAALLYLQHAYGEVSHAEENRINSPSDLDTTAMLQTVMTDETIEVRLLGMSLPYGFEFLGNYTAPMLTPVTLGKTLSMLTLISVGRMTPILCGDSDRGQMLNFITFFLGEFLMRMQCYPNMSMDAVRPFLRGAIASGAVLCLQDCEHLPVSVKESLAECLRKVKEALASRKEVSPSAVLPVGPDGTSVSIHVSSSFHAVLTTGFFSEVPLSLSLEFRPLHVPRMNFAEVICGYLDAHGMTDPHGAASARFSVMYLQFQEADRCTFTERNLIAVLRYCARHTRTPNLKTSKVHHHPSYYTSGKHHQHNGTSGIRSPVVSCFESSEVSTCDVVSGEFFACIEMLCDAFIRVFFSVLRERVHLQQLLRWHVEHTLCPSSDEDSAAFVQGIASRLSEAVRIHPSDVAPRFASLMECNSNVLLAGPAFSGKTKLWRQWIGSARHTVISPSLMCAEDFYGSARRPGFVSIMAQENMVTEKHFIVVEDDTVSGQMPWIGWPEFSRIPGPQSSFIMGPDTRVIVSSQHMHTVNPRIACDFGIFCLSAPHDWRRFLRSCLRNAPESKYATAVFEIILPALFTSVKKHQDDITLNFADLLSASSFSSSSDIATEFLSMCHRCSSLYCKWYAYAHSSSNCYNLETNPGSGESFELLEPPLFAAQCATFAVIWGIGLSLPPESLSLIVQGLLDAEKQLTDQMEHLGVSDRVLPPLNEGGSSESSPEETVLSLVSTVIGWRSLVQQPSQQPQSTLDFSNSALAVMSKGANNSGNSGFDLDWSSYYHINPHLHTFAQIFQLQSRKNTVRAIECLLNCGQNVLLCGEQGSGRSTVLHSVRHCERWVCQLVCANKGLSATLVQEDMANRLLFRSSGCYGPSMGRKLVVCIDDVHLSSRVEDDLPLAARLISFCEKFNAISAPTVGYIPTTDVVFLGSSSDIRYSGTAQRAFVKVHLPTFDGTELGTGIRQLFEAACARRRVEGLPRECASFIAVAHATYVRLMEGGSASSLPLLLAQSDGETESLVREAEQSLPCRFRDALCASETCKQLIVSNASDVQVATGTYSALVELYGGLLRKDPLTQSKVRPFMDILMTAAERIMRSSFRGEVVPNLVEGKQESSRASSGRVITATAQERRTIYEWISEFELNSDDMREEALDALYTGIAPASTSTKLDTTTSKSVLVMYPAYLPDSGANIGVVWPLTHSSFSHTRSYSITNSTLGGGGASSSRRVSVSVTASGRRQTPATSRRPAPVVGARGGGGTTRTTYFANGNSEGSSRQGSAAAAAMHPTRRQQQYHAREATKTYQTSWLSVHTIALSKVMQTPEAHLVLISPTDFGIHRMLRIACSATKMPVALFYARRRDCAAVNGSSNSSVVNASEFCFETFKTELRATIMFACQADTRVTAYLSHEVVTIPGVMRVIDAIISVGDISGLFTQEERAILMSSVGGGSGGGGGGTSMKGGAAEASAVLAAGGSISMSQQQAQNSSTFHFSISRERSLRPSPLTDDADLRRRIRRCLCVVVQVDSDVSFRQLADDYPATKHMSQLTLYSTTSVDSTLRRELISAILTDTEPDATSVADVADGSDEVLEAAAKENQLVLRAPVRDYALARVIRKMFNTILELKPITRTEQLIDFVWCVKQLRAMRFAKVHHDAYTTCLIARRGDLATAEMQNDANKLKNALKTLATAKQQKVDMETTLKAQEDANVMLLAQAEEASAALNKEEENLIRKGQELREVQARSDKALASVALRLRRVKPPFIRAMSSMRLPERGLLIIKAAYRVMGEEFPKHTTSPSELWSIGQKYICAPEFVEGVTSRVPPRSAADLPEGELDALLAMKQDLGEVRYGSALPYAQAIADYAAAYAENARVNIREVEPMAAALAESKAAFELQRTNLSELHSKAQSAKEAATATRLEMSDLESKCELLLGTQSLIAKKEQRLMRYVGMVDRFVGFIKKDEEEKKMRYAVCAEGDILLLAAYYSLLAMHEDWAELYKELQTILASYSIPTSPSLSDCAQPLLLTGHGKLVDIFVPPSLPQPHRLALLALQQRFLWRHWPIFGGVCEVYERLLIEYLQYECRGCTAISAYDPALQEQLLQAMRDGEGVLLRDVYGEAVLDLLRTLAPLRPKLNALRVEGKTTARVPFFFFGHEVEVHAQFFIIATSATTLPASETTVISQWLQVTNLHKPIVRSARYNAYLARLPASGKNVLEEVHTKRVLLYHEMRDFRKAYSRACDLLSLGLDHIAHDGDADLDALEVVLAEVDAHDSQLIQHSVYLQALNRQQQEGWSMLAPALNRAADALRVIEAEKLGRPWDDRVLDVLVNNLTTLAPEYVSRLSPQRLDDLAKPQRFFYALTNFLETAVRCFACGWPHRLRGTLALMFFTAAVLEAEEEIKPQRGVLFSRYVEFLTEAQFEVLLTLLAGRPKLQRRKRGHKRESQGVSLPELTCNLEATTELDPEEMRETRTKQAGLFRSRWQRTGSFTDGPMLSNCEDDANGAFSDQVNADTAEQDRACKQFILDLYRSSGDGLLRRLAHSIDGNGECSVSSPSNEVGPETISAGNSVGSGSSWRPSAQQQPQPQPQPQQQQQQQNAVPTADNGMGFTESVSSVTNLFRALAELNLETVDHISCRIYSSFFASVKDSKSVVEVVPGPKTPSSTSRSPASNGRAAVKKVTGAAAAEGLAADLRERHQHRSSVSNPFLQSQSSGMANASVCVSEDARITAVGDEGDDTHNTTIPKVHSYDVLLEKCVTYCVPSCILSDFPDATLKHVRQQATLNQWAFHWYAVEDEKGAGQHRIGEILRSFYQRPANMHGHWIALYIRPKHYGSGVAEAEAAAAEVSRILEALQRLLAVYAGGRLAGVASGSGPGTSRVPVCLTLILTHGVHSALWGDVKARSALMYGRCLYLVRDLASPKRQILHLWTSNAVADLIKRPEKVVKESAPDAFAGDEDSLVNTRKRKKELVSDALWDMSVLVGRELLVVHVGMTERQRMVAEEWHSTHMRRHACTEYRPRDTTDDERLMMVLHMARNWVLTHEAAMNEATKEAQQLLKARKQQRKVTVGGVAGGASADVMTMKEAINTSSLMRRFSCSTSFGAGDAAAAAGAVGGGNHGSSSCGVSRALQAYHHYRKQRIAWQVQQQMAAGASGVAANPSILMGTTKHFLHENALESLTIAAGSPSAAQAETAIDAIGTYLAKVIFSIFQKLAYQVFIGSGLNSESRHALRWIADRTIVAPSLSGIVSCGQLEGPASHGLAVAPLLLDGDTSAPEFIEEVSRHASDLAELCGDADALRAHRERVRLHLHRLFFLVGPQCFFSDGAVIAEEDADEETPAMVEKESDADGTVEAMVEMRDFLESATQMLSDALAPEERGAKHFASGRESVVGRNLEGKAPSRKESTVLSSPTSPLSSSVAIRRHTVAPSSSRSGEESMFSQRCGGLSADSKLVAWNLQKEHLTRFYADLLEAQQQHHVNSDGSGEEGESSGHHNSSHHHRQRVEGAVIRQLLATCWTLLDRPPSLPYFPAPPSLWLPCLKYPKLTMHLVASALRAKQRVLFPVQEHGATDASQPRKGSTEKDMEQVLLVVTLRRLLTPTDVLLTGASLSPQLRRTVKRLTHWRGEQFHAQPQALCDFRDGKQGTPDDVVVAARVAPVEVRFSHFHLFSNALSQQPQAAARESASTVLAGTILNPLPSKQLRKCVTMLEPIDSPVEAELATDEAAAATTAQPGSSMTGTMMMRPVYVPARVRTDPCDFLWRVPAAAQMQSLTSSQQHQQTQLHQSFMQRSRFGTQPSLSLPGGGGQSGRLHASCAASVAVEGENATEGVVAAGEEASATFVTEGPFTESAVPQSSRRRRTEGATTATTVAPHSISTSSTMPAVKDLSYKITDIPVPLLCFSNPCAPHDALVPDVLDALHTDHHLVASLRVCVMFEGLYSPHYRPSYTKADLFEVIRTCGSTVIDGTTANTLSAAEDAGETEWHEEAFPANGAVGHYIYVE